MGELQGGIGRLGRRHFFVMDEQKRDYLSRASQRHARTAHFIACLWPTASWRRLRCHISGWTLATSLSAHQQCITGAWSLRGCKACRKLLLTNVHRRNRIQWARRYSSWTCRCGGAFQRQKHFLPLWQPGPRICEEVCRRGIQAQSPDLNPIENLWHKVALEISRRRPTTKRELIASVGYISGYCTSRDLHPSGDCT